MIRVLSLLLCLAVHLPTQAAEVTRLALNVRYQVPAESVDETSRLNLYLGDDAVVAERDGVLEAYDLRDRSRLVIDPASGRYERVDLHALVLERNRERDLMITARVGGSVAAVEHAVSLDIDDGVDIERVETDGEVVYRAGEMVLLRHSSDGPALARGAARALVLYLRYSIGGHPQILSRLLADGFMPRSLFNERRGRLSERWTFELVALDSAAPPSLSTSGMQRAVDDDLAAALAALDTALADPERVASFADAQAMRVREQLEADRPLRAFLEGLIYSNYTGQALPAELAQALDARSRDPDISYLTRVLQRAESATPRAAFGRIARLRESHGAHPMLDLIEAVPRRQSGEYGALPPLYLSALERVPLLPPVWADLASIYFGPGFDSPVEAWRCWRAVRAIDPAHPALAPLRRMETALELGFPEYFGDWDGTAPG